MKDFIETNTCSSPTWADIFEYDPSVPSCLVWKVSRGNVKAGEAAGSKHKKGYMRVRYGSKNYLAHRIVYELCTGDKLGDDQIDHKDGDATNNKIGNLRRATAFVQSQNLKQYISNTSGITGVRLTTNKGLEYAQAYWTEDGKKRFFQVRTDCCEHGLELCELVREEAIDKMNLLGAEYTERHGLKALPFKQEDAA